MPSTFTERENLDAAAKGLVVVAGILMAVAVVAIVWSVAGEGPAFTPLCVAGAAVGLALWMFLFAQLIYIRAALEK
jgi:fatty acid desaturase